MYSLSDYIPYTGNIRDGNHKILVWSSKTWYYFTSFGFVLMVGDTQIIGQEK